MASLVWMQDRLSPPGIAFEKKAWKLDCRVCVNLDRTLVRPLPDIFVLVCVCFFGVLYIRI